MFSVLKLRANRLTGSESESGGGVVGTEKDEALGV